MDATRIRNLAALVGVVALVIIGVIVVGSVVTSIVPVLLTAVIAFILGRLSVNFNLLEWLRQRRANKASKPAEKPERAVKQAASPVVEKSPRKAVDVPAQPAAEEEEIDFKVKTVDDVLAESRRLEEEVSKRNTGYDPAAALEERRRRLFGDQSEGSS